MDGLVVLIVLLCSIIGIVNSAKKKPTNKGAGSAQADATNVAPGKKPVSRIPFTREEWAHYLREELGKQEAPEPAEEPPKRASQPRLKQPTTPFANAAPVATPTKAGMQGESTAEHAEHLKRIAAEDAAVLQARENARRLRDTNQQKLRTAVVMSEILNKPVAMRARTGLHR